jgi:hypothetical protein
MFVQGQPVVAQMLGVLGKMPSGFNSVSRQVNKGYAHQTGVLVQVRGSSRNGSATAKAM